MEWEEEVESSRKLGSRDPFSFSSSPFFFPSSLVSLSSCQTTIKLIFNTALICASLDPEESLLAPCVRPTVLNDPVLSSVRGGSPSGDQDSVSSCESSRYVVVYTRFVGEEVLVYHETSLDRSVLHNVVLSVSRGSKVLGGTRLCLVLGEGVRWVVALGRARWYESRSRLVWHTFVRYDTSLLEISPCVAQISTSASVITGITGNHVLRTQDWEGGVALCDTEAIGKSLGSGEGPARTTLSLVSHRVSTLRPVLIGIKACWKIVLVESVGNLWKTISLRVDQECTQHVLDLRHSLSLEDVVFSSNPGCSRVLGVYTVDDSLVQDERISESCCNEHKEGYEGENLHGWWW